MAGIRLVLVIFPVLDARVALLSLILLIMAAATPTVLGWLAFCLRARTVCFPGEARQKAARSVRNFPAGEYFG
jgi:hypothetical protein